MNEAEIRKALKKELRHHEQSRRRGTLTSLFATGLTVVGILAALLMFIFLPRIEASKAHARMRTMVVDKIAKHKAVDDVKEDKVTAKINRLERKIDVIGIRIGARRAIELIDSTVTAAD